MASATGSAPAHADPGREFLTFRLSNEEYGIDILRVQEVRGYAAVTPIANVPPFIKGVMNLRGAIVPVVDMRIKFSMGEASYTERTVVIVLNVAGRVVGMVVDGVSDVVALTAGQLLPAPEFHATLDTSYITGLGTLDERMLIMVDIERLMASDAMQLMNPAITCN